MSKVISYLLTLGAFCAAATAACAATVGGGGMPWDGPLQTIQTDLSGTTATAVSLIAIVGVFGVLIFGGELTHFMRVLCFIILCVSTLVAGNNLLAMFNIAGATVDQPEAGLREFAFGFGLANIFWVVGIWARKKYRAYQARQIAAVLETSSVG